MRDSRVLGGWGQPLRGVGQRVAFIILHARYPLWRKALQCIFQVKVFVYNNNKKNLIHHLPLVFMGVLAMVLALIGILVSFPINLVTAHALVLLYISAHWPVMSLILMKVLTEKIWRFNCGLCALNECNSRDFSPCAYVPFTVVHCHTAAAATWAHARESSRVS